MPEPQLYMHLPRFEFRAAWSGMREASRCLLRVYRNLEPHAEDAFVAVATELDDNPGPSVTNGAEGLNFAVKTVLDPATFVLVEHYRKPDRYALVAVFRDAGRPEWMHLDEARVLELIGELPT